MPSVGLVQSQREVYERPGKAESERTRSISGLMEIKY